MKLFILLLIIITSALAGRRFGSDLIILGEKNSTIDKQLLLGDQFIFKTSSDTDELTLSVNSGSDFSPLLTASTGGGGGGNGLIESVPGSTVDNSVTVWTGSTGDSLDTTPVIFSDLGDVTGVASLTMTGSLTIGTASPVSLFEDGEGNIICQNDNGTRTTLCSAGGGGGGGGGSFAYCSIRLAGWNGYGSASAPFFSSTMVKLNTLVYNNCPSGDVSENHNDGYGHRFVINTPGQYAFTCGMSYTTEELSGITLNSSSNGEGNTPFQSVVSETKLCSNNHSGSDGFVGCTAVRTLEAGDVVTCQSDGTPNLQGNNDFFYVERLR